ncbi:MAG: anthranilate synthase component I [Candidatus Firestonebacteria bacterium]|nr:anthranilate synthase component I [Candidatus Firestonebacteria bacterium]
MFYPDLNEFINFSKKGNLIPVYKEILADIETPVSAFIKIDNGKYSYLLESVEGGEKIARYSFLGSDPSIIFLSKKGKAKIIENGKIKEIEKPGSPFKILKELLKKYKPVSINGLPRFHGGAVGFLSYDMVRYFENIPDNNIDELNLPESLFVFTDTILVFDHINHSIKVVTNTYIDNNANVKKLYEEAKIKIEAIINKLKKPLIIDNKNKFNKNKIKIKSNTVKKVFIQNVNKAKEYIRAGDIFQVVLSQRLNINISCDPFDIYRALRKINPSPYMFFLRMGEMIIVGSSPEILVRVENRCIEVRPIAGTRRRGKDEIEDEKLKNELYNDPKERAEHIMLVDLGRNDIGKVSKYSSVHVPELMTIEKNSHVMHMVTDVLGEIESDKDVFDCISATFPAGTVSGAPKIRAMEIIDELEKTRRGIYAGAVGYISFSGNLDTCITIRTILIKDGTAYIQAGAGIVADSIPEKEYEETLNKAMGMIKAIEMAEGGLE